MRLELILTADFFILLLILSKKRDFLFLSLLTLTWVSVSFMREWVYSLRSCSKFCNRLVMIFWSEFSGSLEWSDLTWDIQFSSVMGGILVSFTVSSIDYRQFQNFLLSESRTVSSSSKSLELKKKSFFFWFRKSLYCLMTTSWYSSLNVILRGSRCFFNWLVFAVRAPWEDILYRGLFVEIKYLRSNIYILIWLISCFVCCSPLGNCIARLLTPVYTLQFLLFMRVFFLRLVVRAIFHSR